MTAGDREGLVARIRQVRRSAAVRDQPIAQAGEVRPEPPRPERIQDLEARVAHLEQLVEGLQDSVHRESERHAEMIVELQSQVEPAAMRAAIAKDSRSRRL